MANPSQAQQVATASPRALVANKGRRSALLQQLEQERNSRIIAYATADRKVLPTQIANDIIPIFHQHLDKIGKTDRIDVFLYTRGGHTLTPNRLVHLIREYCTHLGVLVPFRAHSSGTTFALGTNEIVMGPMGELGPVDPTVANAFNPEADVKKPNSDKKDKIGISVEDVTAFLTLAKEKAGIESPEAMGEVMRILCDNIHPLALGNVHRQHQLIRTMSKRLLALHMDPEEEASRIDKIVDVLSEKLYYHGYEISRKEARDVVGLPVTMPSPTLEKAMWDLYCSYAADIPLRDPAIGQGAFVVDGGIIESAGLSYSFVLEGTAAPTKDGFNIDIKKTGWTPI